MSSAVGMDGGCHNDRRWAKPFQLSHGMWPPPVHTHVRTHVHTHVDIDVYTSGCTRVPSNIPSNVQSNVPWQHPQYYEFAPPESWVTAELDFFIAKSYPGRNAFEALADVKGEYIGIADGMSTARYIGIADGMSSA